MDTNEPLPQLSPSDRALILEYRVKVGCATLARQHGTYAMVRSYELQAQDRLSAMSEAARKIASAR